jgi:hypothetical protein
LPALRAVYDAVLEAGGNPTLIFSDEYMTRSFARRPPTPRSRLDPSPTLYYEQADATFALGAGRTHAP